MPVTLVHDITTYLWLTSQFSNREVVNATSFPMVGLIGPAKCTPRLRLAQSPRRTSWPESMAKERNSKIQVDTGFPMNFFTSQNSDGMVEWMDSFWDRASSSSPSGDQKYPCFKTVMEWLNEWIPFGTGLHHHHQVATRNIHVFFRRVDRVDGQNWALVDMVNACVHLNIPEYEWIWEFTVYSCQFQRLKLPIRLQCFWWRSLHFWNVMSHQVDKSSHMHFWGNRQTKTCLRWSLNPFCSVQLPKRRMVWLYSQCLNGSISLRRAQLPLWQEGTEICVDWCRPLYVTWT